MVKTRATPRDEGRRRRRCLSSEPEYGLPPSVQPAPNVRSFDCGYGPRLSLMPWPANVDVSPSRARAVPSTRCAVASGPRGSWQPGCPFGTVAFEIGALSAQPAFPYSPTTNQPPTTHPQCILQCCTRAASECSLVEARARSVSLAAGLGRTTRPDQPAEPGFLGPIMPPRTPGS